MTASGAAVQVRALVFDVFGTVVDWRSSVAAEVRALGWPVDPAAFADAWRAGYVPAMQAVRAVVDELETIVADDHWPLPTYQEMLFIK